MSADTIRLAIDAMGGDEGPAMVLPGLEIVLKRCPQLRFDLFGDEERLTQLLAERPALAAASLIHHAGVAIPMDARPSQALRMGRRDSSMWRSLDCLRKGEAQAMVSAGNTGALMAMALFCLRPMAGIDRPALAAIWPTVRGESIVLDVGASIGVETRNLVTHAILGAAMSRAVFGIERPTVGLLNIGVEEVKGLEEVREAGRVLRQMDLPSMRYEGFVEGDDIGRGTVDVVVTEGFSGNIALKTAEGTARQLAEYLRMSIGRTLRARLGYLLARPAFMRLRDKMDRCSSASTALPSRATAAPTRKGSRAPWSSPTTWCATTCNNALRRTWPHLRRRESLQTRVDPQRHQAGDDARRTANIRRAPTERAPVSMVAGVGAALPSRVLTNDQLATMVDTSDEWITARTGIRERRIAADGEFTSHLAARAAQDALRCAGLGVGDIDLVIVATATPDHTFPATAVVVQEPLGMTHGAAFDVGAACAGFVYGLTTADALIGAGAARRALVIGAETFSRILDWTDRTTCVLFGDGAGAVVLEATEGRSGASGRGIISHALRSDGSHRDKLYVDGGPSTTRTTGHVRMRGQEVFRFAIQATVDVVEDVLSRAGLTAGQVDWFVPHQANKRIIDASARKLGIAPAKVVLTVGGHGNTSAASIPLALNEAALDGRIKPGDVVLMEALGGGFTWAAAVLRW